MFLPQPLPRTLYEEVGKIVVIWATIEQDIILHASAMAARKTDGKPTDYLRMDFKRLREKWFSLCRENFKPSTMNKIVNPLNVDLARLSIERGNAVHGMWCPAGRGKFKLISHEQKTQLISYESDITLAQLRAVREASYFLSLRLHEFTSGQNGPGEVVRAFLKPAHSLIPSD